jgi:hypothetical protein
MGVLGRARSLRRLRRLQRGARHRAIGLADAQAVVDQQRDERRRPRAVGFGRIEQLLEFLDRVRQVTQTDKKPRFTALLHHVAVDRVRAAYWALEPKAARGANTQSSVALVVRQPGRIPMLSPSLHYQNGAADGSIVRGRPSDRQPLGRRDSGDAGPLVV